MTTYYRIKNWDKHFENNRTREMKKLSWVPFPNKHDGDGYTELLDHPNGASHYGAWCALVQVASKCDVRGTLLRDTAESYNPTSLARVTRIPANVWEECIPRLVKLKWLETCENTAGGCDPSTAGGCLLPEQNRTEQKEEKRPPAECRFAPPSLDELKAYIREKSYTFSAEQFIAFYDSKGWMVGKNKMKDWKAACVTWQSKQPPKRVSNVKYD